MERKEGIIKMYKDGAGKEPDLQTAGKLWQTEYNNYKELCYYCNEEPLQYGEWLEEEIKEAKN